MRKTFSAGLAGLAFVLAGPVLAQDMSADPAAETMSTDPAAQTTGYDTPGAVTTPDPTTEDEPFTGLYVGGAAGYDVQSNDVGSSILFDRGSNGSFGEAVTTGTGANAFSPGFCNGAANAATPAGGCRNDRDDLGYYGRVGLDYQAGKIVVGVVGEFGRSEITDSVSAFSTTPANYVMTRSVDWEASIRGRAGFVAGRSTLFYGTFGPSYARIDNDFRSTNAANAFASTNKDRVWGITGGGGVEQLIGNNFSIGLEYMYHQYDDNDARVSVTQGTSPANNPFVLAGGVDFRRSDEKFRWHSLRGTANFRF